MHHSASSDCNSPMTISIVITFMVLLLVGVGSKPVSADLPISTTATTTTSTATKSNSTPSEPLQQMISSPKSVCAMRSDLVGCSVFAACSHAKSSEQTTDPPSGITAGWCNDMSIWMYVPWTRQSFPDAPDTSASALRLGRAPCAWTFCQRRNTSSRSCRTCVKKCQRCLRVRRHRRQSLRAF